ncbi:hypothetical protein [Nocardia takedensis]|uniref:hypothetical protein n=1 Tax=Nocardia takedensis TaxID=259390 RepID=UPI0002FE6293|nr:hypothetical protein [Nocardia takedensis]
MTRARLAVLAAAVLLGSACTVHGTAVPADGGYRAMMGPDRGQALADAAERDRVRLIDPCAMLDEPAIRDAIGAPRHFGANHDLDECEVRFDPDATPARIGYVTVGLSVIEDGFGQKTRFGARTGTVSDNSGMCSIALPFERGRSFHYILSGKEGADLCGPLIRIVTASEPALNNPAPRSQSRRLPATPGSTKDPCAALNLAYDPGQRFDILSFNPFECDFRLDFTSSDTSRYHVTYVNWQKSLLDFPRPEDRQLRVLGVAATEESGSDDYCKITIATGADHPFLVVDYRGETEQWIETIEVAGHSCAETRRLAVAAVKAHRQS